MLRSWYTYIDFLGKFSVSLKISLRLGHVANINYSELAALLTQSKNFEQMIFFQHDQSAALIQVCLCMRLKGPAGNWTDLYLTYSESLQGPDSKIPFLLDIGLGIW